MLYVYTLVVKWEARDHRFRSPCLLKFRFKHTTKHLSHDSSVRSPRHDETSFGGCFKSIYKLAEYALSALFRVFCFFAAQAPILPPSSHFWVKN